MNSQPVSVTDTGLVEGRTAIPVAVDDDSPMVAGPAIPVRVITDADLVQNGGTWLVEGRPQPWRVVAAEEGALVDGRVAALPVYVVSGSLSTAPLPPVSLSALPTGAAFNRTLLQWTAQTPSAAYEIRYGTNGVDYAALATTAVDATSYTHATPTLGVTRHYYEIRTVTDGGESEWVAVTLDDWALSTVVFWPLNEVSGDAIDVVGSNDLTDFNTVGSTTGVLGTVRRFVSANFEYFERASNSVVGVGDEDFSFAFWIHHASGMVGGEVPFAKWDGVGAGPYVLLNADGRIRFQLHGGGGDIIQDSVATVNFDEWNLVVLTHDATANLTGVSINGGAFETKATGASLDGVSAGQDFDIGRWGGGQYWNGDLSRFARSTRAWTINTVQGFYNNGDAADYPS